MWKLLVASILGLLIPLALTELALRVALFTPHLPIAALRDPGLYAGWSDDDDYWKLHYRLSGRWYPKERSTHPLLGWSQSAPSPENPLGLGVTRAQWAEPRPKILFYGDSFLRGLASPPYWIPAYLSDRLNTVTVLDLGVGGFGLDQIYLIFQQTVRTVPNPTVIIGVLHDDLDRSVLGSRTYQKPRFVLESGELRLTNVPIEPDVDRYRREHPPQIRSYLVSALIRLYARYSPSLAEKLSRRAEKEAINAKIIEKLQQEALASNVPIFFLLFYEQHYLASDSWQETFLKAKLSELQIPYVDTKPILKHYAGLNSLTHASFYVKNDGHHNDLGNKVIAEALLEFLKSQGYR